MIFHYENNEGTLFPGIVPVCVCVVSVCVVSVLCVYVLCLCVLMQKELVIHKFTAIK